MRAIRWAAVAIFLGGIFVGILTAQDLTPVPLGDYLRAEYGNTVEWTVQAGADGPETITLWRNAPSQARSAPIPQPTEAQIAAWRADAALTDRLRAAESRAAYPVERALILALCASLTCDADTVWAAFLAAVDP